MVDGGPIAEKSRLTPEKLKITKAEFEFMAEQGSTVGDMSCNYCLSQICNQQYSPYPPISRRHSKTVDKYLYKIHVAY